MQNAYRRLSPFIWSLAFVCSLVAVASPQNKGNQNNKNDEAEIRAAQAKLEDVKKAASEAQKDAQEAQKHVAQVRSELIALRRKIEDAADGSKNLKQAQERVDKAKATLAPLVAPILAELHKQPEYTAAAQTRDQLRSQLAAAVDRSAHAKQIADAEGALRKLESAALERSPAVVKAKEAVAQAEADLRKELEVADGALAKDSRYQNAKKDLDRAEGQAAAAVAKAAAKQRDVAAAQNKVQAEIAEERREDAKERQQQQNKNKNKKKK